MPKDRDTASHRLRTARAVALAAALLAPAMALAGSPQLHSLDLLGAQRGTEVIVTLRGERLHNPHEVVWYEPGIATTKIEKVDDRSAKVTLKIAPDCAIGEHHLRLRTADGWTELRTFYVGSTPVIEEKEPNSDFGNPQKIPMNVTVQGAVQPEDVDYFAVEAKKGQRITAEIEAIRLGITLFDPYVAILDAKRFELAACDDSPLLKQDSTVSAIAPEDGVYTIVVRESAFGGGDNARYRLHVGDLPRPTAVYPSGGAPGESIKFTFLGDKSGPIESVVKLPDEPDAEFALIAEQNGKLAPSPNWVRVAAMPNVLEVKPNGDREHATAAPNPPPVAFNGILDKPGAEGWFRFSAKKDQALDLRVFARLPMRSPIDSVLEVFNGSGARLAENDDANGGSDSQLRFTPPADGDYFIRVRDHLGKGGPDWTYRVEVAPPARSLSLRINEVARNDAQSRQWVAVPRGGRWLGVFQVERNGVGGDVGIACDGLPAGVTVRVPPIRKGQNQIPVVFEADAGAAIAGSLADLTVRPVDEKVKIVGRFRQNAVLVRGNPNETPYYATQVERLAVAVTEESPYSIELETPATPILRSGQMNLRVIAKRVPGFDEPIVLEMPYRSPGIGAAANITIEKGMTEASFPVSASGDAQDGEWPLVILAHSKVKGGSLYTSSGLATLKVAPQLLGGEVQMAAAEQGQTVEVVCKLTKVRDFTGDATLTLEGLPPRCSAQAVTVNKDAKEVVFKVLVDKTTPPGQHKSLFLSLAAPSDGGTVTHTFAGGGVMRIDKPRVPEPVAAAPSTPAPAPAATPAPEQPRRLSRLEQLRQQQSDRK